MDKKNTVCVDGDVVTSPTRHLSARGVYVCRFRLSHAQFSFSNGVASIEEKLFEVEAWGKISEECFYGCTMGRAVRITGRCRRGDGGITKMLACTVEFIS